MKPLTIILFLTLCGVGGVLAEIPETSLLSNGDFEATGLGVPGGWPERKGLSYEEEDGNHFLRLEAVEPELEVQAHRLVPLPAGCKALEISLRVRYADIVPGAEKWHDGRLIMHFKDASGQTVKPDPKPMIFKGSSNGWVEKRETVPVPEGAVAIEFMPALFQVAMGTLDVDDVAIVPVDAPAP